MFNNEIQKQLLLEFRFRLGQIGMTRDQKILELRKMAEVVIPYKNQMPISVRRKQFDDVKRKLHKMKIARNRFCFCCGSVATCRHHIIQIQNGGINSRKNLVSLCDGCHSDIHPWLKTG